MPEEDAEQEVAHIEATLRENYVDLRKIFEFYAAGGEGGAPTDISDAEWHRFCDDCKFAKKRNMLKKTTSAKFSMQPTTASSQKKWNGLRALRMNQVVMTRT